MRDVNKGWIKSKSGPEEQASFRTAESSQACGQKKLTDVKLAVKNKYLDKKTYLGIDKKKVHL